jgi:hypothetical protein
METTSYFLVQSGFIVLTLACLALVLSGLWRALQASPYQKSRKRRLFWVTLSGFVCWLAFLSILSAQGFFQDFSAFPPRIAIALLPPTLLVLGLTFSKGFAQLLGYVPASWIVYLQTFRLFVEILLWALFVQNLVPVQMTFEGRNGDILVGLTAPFIAYFCLTRANWPETVVLWWNVAGLIIVTNIVVTAILSMPTPLRVFMNEPANTIVAYFPIIWLPGVLVPLAYALHFFSLRQISLRRASSRVASYQRAT